MSYNKYIPISEDRYNIIQSRYEEFLEDVDSFTANPTKVFDPLSPVQMEEIMLIREISMELQKKKEEDMKKAQSVEPTEAEVKEAEENGAEEVAVQV